MKKVQLWPLTTSPWVIAVTTPVSPETWGQTRWWWPFWVRDRLRTPYKIRQLTLVTLLTPSDRITEVHPQTLQLTNLQIISMQNKIGLVNIEESTNIYWKIFLKFKLGSVRTLVISIDDLGFQVYTSIWFWWQLYVIWVPKGVSSNASEISDDILSRLESGKI